MRPEHKAPAAVAVSGIGPKAGDGAPAGELAARVVGRHRGVLPSPGGLHVHYGRARGGERLRRTDPERMPGHSTLDAGIRGPLGDDGPHGAGADGRGGDGVSCGKGRKDTPSAGKPGRGRSQAIRRRKCVRDYSNKTACCFGRSVRADLVAVVCACGTESLRRRPPRGSAGQGAQSSAFGFVGSARSNTALHARSRQAGSSR